MCWQDFGDEVDTPSCARQVMDDNVAPQEHLDALISVSQAQS